MPITINGIIRIMGMRESTELSIGSLRRSLGRWRRRALAAAGGCGTAGSFRPGPTADSNTSTALRRGRVWSGGLTGLGRGTGVLLWYAALREVGPPQERDELSGKGCCVAS